MEPRSLASISIHVRRARSAPSTSKAPRCLLHLTVLIKDSFGKLSTVAIRRILTRVCWRFIFRCENGCELWGREEGPARREEPVANADGLKSECCACPIGTGSYRCAVGGAYGRVHVTVEQNFVHARLSLCEAQRISR